MDLRFDTSLAEGYKSASQVARVLTEDWLARNMYCPICGEVSIRRAEPNAPVKDYVCGHCNSQYELKSKKSTTSSFSSTVADGVYQTMIERITSLENPSFFFLHYDRYEVNNLVIVPKCFFVPAIIEKRTPLQDTARRAGWEGCNIIMRDIPAIAKIPVIKDGIVLPEDRVINEYNRIYKLQTGTLEGRGWLVDTLNVVEKLDKEFSLNEVYAFIDELQIKHPENHHIQDKLRQQLQILRGKGLIEFKGQGKYRRL